MRALPCSPASDYIRRAHWPGTQEKDQEALNRRAAEEKSLALIAGG
jgi:hypothetical protein